MKSVYTSEPANLLRTMVSSLGETKTALNITLLYEDAPSRVWAKELYQRITALSESHTMQATWWRISELTEPGVLAGAVSTAMRADIIVVAGEAREGLPLPFYVWVNSWLPNRKQESGALVALLGSPSSGGSRCGRVVDFLGIVAEQARMKFMVQQRYAKETASVDAELCA